MPTNYCIYLPIDEHIVKDRGTSMIILNKVSEAKYIAEEQRKYVNFDSFVTHTISHECCRDIGPHTITLSDGQNLM